MSFPPPVTVIPAKAGIQAGGKLRRESRFANKTVILRPEGPKDLRFFGLRPQNDVLVLGAISFLLLSSPAAFANVAGNFGFEEDIGSGTERNWDNTNGATRVTTATLPAGGFTAVPEGTFALAMTAAAHFTFQIYDHVKAGDFVSFSALAESAVAAGGGAQGGQVRIEFRRKRDDNTDELISAVNSAFITTANAAPGGGYVRFTVTGVAPPDTRRVSFVLREQVVGGNMVFDNLNAEVNPLEFAVAASKNHVKAGEVVTIQTRYTNASAAALNDVELFAQIPAGIDFLRDTIRVNNRSVGFREGSLIIPIGTLAANDSATASFQVLVTHAVTAGKQYDIELVLANNTTLSERAHVRLIIEEDPVFDQGTLLGKVFHDANENGVQDSGERGVPWVRLATEEGIVVVTDENGKYHVPNISPGRHVVKIDGRTLPEETKFITEESYLFKTTPGIMNKVNFAVLIPPSSIPPEFHKDLVVSVTQGLDTSQPILGVQMEPDLLKSGLGVLEKEPVFKLQVNYEDFLKTWYLEIQDELGREVWTGFGISTPPSEVVWTGQTETGLLIKPGLYSYRFKVVDKASREDWTPLHFFRVISKTDPAASEDLAVEIPPVGDFNIMRDGKRSIPLVAKPTIHIEGLTRPDNRVTVNKRPVPVDGASGRFQTEFYATPGPKEIVVAAINPDGESISHRQTVKVKDSTFFMVALGEQEGGFNFSDGNLEAAGSDSHFRKGFYQDGRLAYYLRGKLKGKFLFKSRYDTGDKHSGLFTNLDPEDYYPIYGDAATRDDEGRDTGQRFFLVVEMERSFVKWGSFETAFHDTELTTYNRTLSGLKFSYETLGSTVYGDPNRGLKGFWTQAGWRADHNEFAATGGSLYYLRNRRVIEGSEKLRVEIRDKIQNMPVESYDLKEGQDYEIDYDEGRILLSRPLSSVAASDTLISRDLLDGNPVYLVVDYEFDAGPSLLEHENRGLRGYTHMGGHLRIGGTAVEEKRGPGDYDLRGLDARLRFGRNTEITAEYAESISRQMTQSISYNGGLSFADLGSLPARRPREQAYLIKGQTKPVKNLEASAYLQDVQPGFSTDRIRSQEGLKKYGVNARYKFHDYFSTRYRYDSSEVESQLRPLQEHRVAAEFERLHSHTAQAVYDDGKWLAQAEYLRQNFDLTETDPNLIPSLLSEVPFRNALAGKVGYRLNERLLPYVKVQTTLDGEANHQFGGGVRYEVIKDFTASIEQMFGRLGDSTFFGLERQHSNRLRTYANLRMSDRGIGSKTLATHIGSSYSLTEKSRVYSERQYSAYDGGGGEGTADIYGYEGKAAERWDFGAKFERRHLDNSLTRLLDIQAANSLTRTNTFNAISGSVGYTEPKKLRARTTVELRRDQDAPKLWQWVTRNDLEYQIDPDLGLGANLNYGGSRFSDPDDSPAAFMELSTGFAYRPLAHDRLNLLTRYTFIHNLANDLQFLTPLFEGLETDETAHIASLDLAYDLHRYLGLVEKVAFKRAVFGTPLSRAVVHSYLWAHRFNFHITRKWDIALEYRILLQSEAADSLRHGPLVEIDREFYDYVRLGLGYNFTDFDDDLRKANDFKSHGPFVRLTGKF